MMQSEAKPPMPFLTHLPCEPVAVYFVFNRNVVSWLALVSGTLVSDEELGKGLSHCGRRTSYLCVVSCAVCPRLSAMWWWWQRDAEPVPLGVEALCDPARSTIPLLMHAFTLGF